MIPRPDPLLRCMCGSCRPGASSMRRRDGFMHTQYERYPTEHYYDPDTIWPTREQERAFRGYGS